MALGVEAAGRLIAAGRAVRLRPGSEVLAFCVPVRDQGAWAERLLVDAASLAVKPGETSWEEAAAISVPALTAARALAAVGVSSGDRVLVAGAGGVTGELLARLALARGARVVATAGPESSKRLAGLGVQLADRHAPDWPEAVRRLVGGKRATATVNAIVGGAGAALAATADHGRLATITGHLPTSERGISVTGVVVRPDGVRLAELVVMLGSRVLQVPLAAGYPLKSGGRSARDCRFGKGWWCDRPATTESSL